MYIPEHFAERRPEQLHRIIRDNPLGMLVTSTASGLDAEHIPFELDSEAGPNGRLLAHVARANTVWRHCAEGLPVMVVFRGANGYISPNGYLSKHETHRQVPTWNYEVVHVHGFLRAVSDARQLRRTLTLLTRHHEASQDTPWRMGDAPADYLDGMLTKIVGIEIDVLRLEGKRKLSQNREPRDRLSTLDHLRQQGRDDLVSAMRQGHES
ncbi:FMN-binding negative transcriptional regulator [Pseudomonas asplenii]|uniref:FMN-binding negative transcriptional regulator n=1 Tax=Pseudomonas asplenii TaxID=53407 RepID=UPI0006B696DC|nr:FMN-binding negative transcriptional regulator [Pseudomonas fuscovaginae]KPA99416.1 negative transcriptional regulator, PaiB family [Pseudomonas fuscovaginae]